MRGRISALAFVASLACPALALTQEAASPALVQHLLSQLEARERPSGGLFGGPSPTALSEFGQADSQLRRLGSRASEAAPRVAELLARSKKNNYNLAITLVNISPEWTPDASDALWEKAQAGEAAARWQALAHVARDPSPTGMHRLQIASAWPERDARLLVSFAVAQRKPAGAVDEPVQLLARMLKDEDKEVRQAALNGLRLTGQRSAAVSQALMDHLRTRENVWMTSEVLTHAPTDELRSIRAELESILGDTKLTAFQKAPATQLLLRIETETPEPKPAQPTKPSKTGIGEA